jgi:hypothetical protein
MCQANIGKGICVTTRDGNVYRGVIGCVDGNAVGIRPIGRGVQGEGDEVFKTLSADGSPKEVKGTEVQWWGSYWWIPFWTIAALSFFFW